MLLQLELGQIMTFFVMGPIVLFFVVLSILLIKRNKNRMIWSLVLYYLTTALGLIFNIAYRALNIEIINIIFNTITIYLASFALIFLLNFNLLLFYSTRIFNRKRQIILNIIYGILSAGLFIIHFFVKNEGVSWVGNDPNYSLWFSLYGLVVSQIVFLLVVYYAIKIKKKMGDNVYSRKYARNIIGFFCFDIQLIAIYFAHYLGIPSVRVIAAIITILGLLSGAVLFYYGLKKEPESS